MQWLQEGTVLQLGVSKGCMAEGRAHESVQIIGHQAFLKLNFGSFDSCHCKPRVLLIVIQVVKLHAQGLTKLSKRAVNFQIATGYDCKYSSDASYQRYSKSAECLVVGWKLQEIKAPPWLLQPLICVHAQFVCVSLMYVLDKYLHVRGSSCWRCGLNSTFSMLVIHEFTSTIYTYISTTGQTTSQVLILMHHHGMCWILCCTQ